MRHASGSGAGRSPGAGAVTGVTTVPGSASPGLSNRDRRRHRARAAAGRPRARCEVHVSADKRFAGRRERKRYNHLRRGGAPKACPTLGEVVTMVEVFRLFVVTLLLVTVMVIIRG